MEVIFLALCVTILLIVTESALLWVLFKSRTKFFRIMGQIVLLLLIPPTYGLAATVIFYLETEEGSATVASRMPKEWDIPTECKNISFHRDPEGEWFSCDIDKRKAEEWLSSRSFGPDLNLQCPTFADSAARKAASLGHSKTKYLQAPMERNGAGSGAMLREDFMFVCRWYW